MAGDSSNRDELDFIHFGPESLYRWLYDNWNNSDRLSQKSKQGIQLLAGQAGLGDDELKKLATSFDYEPLVQALQEDDFGWFVDSVIAKSEQPRLRHSSGEFQATCKARLG